MLPSINQFLDDWYDFDVPAENVPVDQIFPDTLNNIMLIAACLFGIIYVLRSLMCEESLVDNVSFGIGLFLCLAVGAFVVFFLLPIVLVIVVPIAVVACVGSILNFIGTPLRK